MTHYNWTRFWSDPGSTVSGDWGGFLTDPEQHFGGNYGLRSTDALHELLVGGQSLLLLGEPGCGKSVELKRLSESAGLPNTRLVRLGVTGEESRLERRLEQELAALHSRDGVPVLLLDSIDEALFELPKAIGVILDVLARDREANLAVPLRIAVTCRTGALPPDLLLRLQTIVGETKAFELCTLRRRDAELAASAEGIDPEAFLREVADRESEPFAANPSTLKLLLALAKSGSIPAAKVELYQHGLLGLCTQPSEREAVQNVPLVGGDPISPKQMLALARRIAACVIFGGKATIALQETADPEHLTIASMSGGSESLQGEKIDATPTTLRHTLAHSGLFVRFGQGMTFVHRSMAEFLAAWFVVSSDLADAQLDSLVTSPGEAPPPYAPQLKETVAWIADLDAGFRARVAEREPEVLLRGDLPRYTDDERRAVVLGLVNRLDREQLADLDDAFDKGEGRNSLFFFPRYRFLERLGYRGLADDLRPWLTDRTKSMDVHEAAIAIARVNGCGSLSGELASIALNTTLPERTRVQAVLAISDIGDTTSRTDVRPLLSLPAPDDPDDEFKGSVLKALWPGHIDPIELLSCLSRRKRENYAGTYDWFLHNLDLTVHLTAQNICEALDWAAQHPDSNRGNDPLGRISSEILGIAWRHVDAPGALDRLASTTLHRLDEHQPILRVFGASRLDFGNEGRTEANEFVDAQEATRRRIIGACIKTLKTDNDVWRLASHTNVPLLRPTDFIWALEQASILKGRQTSRYAMLAKVISRYQGAGPFDSREHLDLWLTLRGKRKAIRDLWPVKTLIDSPEARKAKAEDIKRQRWEQRAARSAQRPKWDRAEVIESLLHRCETQDVRYFTKVAEKIYFGDNGEGGAAHFRISERTGWGLLSPDQQRRLTVAAKRYLDEGPLEAADNYNPLNAEIAAQAAVHLVEHASTEIQEIGSHRLRMLTPLLVQGLAKSWGDGTEACRRVLSLLLEKEPSLAEVAVFDAILAEPSRQQLPHILDFLPSTLSPTLLAQLTDACSQRLHDQPLVIALLPWLVRHKFTPAEEFALSVLRAAKTSASDPSTIEIASAYAILEADPEKGWQLLKPRLHDNRPWLCGLIARVAPERGGGSTLTRVHEQLSETSVRELLEWLYTDYIVDDWSSRNTPYARVGEWRSMLLNSLIARGTDAAVAALESLRVSFPKFLWLKHVVHTARIRRRHAAWPHCPPRQLLDLRDNAQRRFVRNADELLDVVQESVLRWVAHLRATDTVDAVWNLQHGTDRRYTPVDEETLRDRLSAFMLLDLARSGIVMGREVKITTRKTTDGESGTRLDILVEAVTEAEVSKGLRTAPPSL